MIDQRIIEIVAKNYSEICLEKNEKKLGVCLTEVQVKVAKHIENT